MTFLEMLEAASAQYPPQADVTPVEPPPTCARCRWSETLNDKGHCPDCQAAIDRGYDIVMLAGRCANGSELGKGVLFHAQRIGEYEAVCGAKPGRLSVGWSTWKPSTREVTCQKCLKKLSR